MFTSFVDKVARDVDDQGDKYENGHDNADDDVSACLDRWLGRWRRISRRNSGRGIFFFNCGSVCRREETTHHTPERDRQIRVWEVIWWFFSFFFF